MSLEEEERSQEDEEDSGKEVTRKHESDNHVKCGEQLGVRTDQWKVT